MSTLYKRMFYYLDHFPGDFQNSIFSAISEATGLKKQEIASATLSLENGGIGRAEILAYAESPSTEELDTQA